MSLYEQALEEWKKRDPHLLDLEGFEQFLAEKEKEEQIVRDAKDAYWARNRYCEGKLMDIAIKAVLESEFDFPPKSWSEFFDLAHRYMELVKWRGYNLALDAWGREVCKHFGVEPVTKVEARRIWRRLVKHPEWYRDWNTAIGAKGYTGSEYYLSGLLAICVKLGKEEEASEILNNLPFELRCLAEVPDHIKQYVIEQGWRKTYDVCKGYTSLNCMECVEAP